MGPNIVFYQFPKVVDLMCPMIFGVAYFTGAICLGLKVIVSAVAGR